MRDALSGWIRLVLAELKTKVSGVYGSFHLRIVDDVVRNRRVDGSERITLRLEREAISMTSGNSPYPENLLLGSDAHNFFVFHFFILKFGNSTKSTMGNNPVTLVFLLKKIFFWKIFSIFT